jgi:hypothetical protein
MSENLSRREFLRRTSKEVGKEIAETGARIVPGGALAKKFVENGDAEKRGGFVSPPGKRWWDRLVNWNRAEGDKRG